MYRNHSFRKNTASVWFDRSQISCQINYKYYYTVNMELKNPAFNNAPLNKDILKKFFHAATRFNNYFLSPNPKTQNRKHIENIVFCSDGTILITFATEHKIPNPNRAGNCMRQLTVFMMDVGGEKYLSNDDPKKLLRNALRKIQN